MYGYCARRVQVHSLLGSLAPSHHHTNQNTSRKILESNQTLSCRPLSRRLPGHPGYTLQSEEEGEFESRAALAAPLVFEARPQPLRDIFHESFGGDYRIRTRARTPQCFQGTLTPKSDLISMFSSRLEEEGENDSLPAFAGRIAFQATPTPCWFIFQMDVDAAARAGLRRYYPNSTGTTSSSGRQELNLQPRTPKVRALPD